MSPSDLVAGYYLRAVGLVPIHRPGPFLFHGLIQLVHNRISYACGFVVCILLRFGFLMTYATTQLTLHSFCPFFLYSTLDRRVFEEPVDGYSPLFENKDPNT